MDYDVVIIGGGPSGFGTAIKLAQIFKETNQDKTICVLEKSAEIGGHILSGNVFQTTALDELIPDWKDKDAPIKVEVKKDILKFLVNEKFSFSIPSFLMPTMQNHGNYIISLGNLCRWLGEQAESLGVEIYPGFAAAEILFDEEGSVRGIATNELGVGKDGKPTENYMQGMELIGRQTIFAEGCRGHLTKELFKRFNLREGKDPQTFALGIKELWDIDKEKSKPGTVFHSVGWPLPSDTYGGSFLYHLSNNQVSVGYVVGLDYKNPFLSPFEEFQRFKKHPSICSIFEGGRRVSYGARALNEGGFQSIPKLTFPGGCLVGCTAGFLNVPKIKGTHTAMKSGMLAAEAIFEAVMQNTTETTSYEASLQSSWLWKELYKVRNIRPSFSRGFLAGMIYSAFDTFILRGHAPWTFKHHEDHLQLKEARLCKKIEYPKPDNIISFDKNSSVYLSSTIHEENQPSHL